jgi:hypothetical protein
MDAPLAHGFEFHNATGLDTPRLRTLCREAILPWRTGHLRVFVRYSRGADYSGTCYTGEGRILVNLGRHLTYPYRMSTHLARSVTRGDRWWKPIYTIELADAYQVVLLVFLHECYHRLVRRARRNPRQKESMCDRFAARILVDRHGATVRDGAGDLVPRALWDFQDVEGFIRPLLRQTAPRAAATRPLRPSRDGIQDRAAPRQLLLFEL